MLLAVVGLMLFAPMHPSLEEGSDRRQCFVEAYPGVVCGADDDALVLCSEGLHAAPSARVVWDDGRGDKDHADRIASPDVEDTVATRYQPGPEVRVPPRDHEPGRIRHDGLLSAMYGATRDEVAARTTVVPWMPRSGGRPVRVTSVNGVAAALGRVSDDLERELPEEIKSLVARTAGVFVWRNVRGTKRRSPHSYAIAIDVGTARADYWGWRRPDARGHYRYRNRFPLQVVEIFERHGFIWGGRWYHFDTMHFEYRPELLVAPCVDGPSPLVTLGGRDRPR